MMESHEQKLWVAGALSALVVAILIPVYLSIQSSDRPDANGATAAKPKPRPKFEPSKRTPTDLKKRDLVVGDGPKARLGKFVSIQYLAALTARGKEFDGSWGGTSENFDFKLGTEPLVPGLERGIVGMRVGGRRELTIPPDLAYGPKGNPPFVPGGATVTYIVDLVAVN
jgi:peptidylprolyl isomerase